MSSQCKLLADTDNHLTVRQSETEDDIISSVRGTQVVEVELNDEDNSPENLGVFEEVPTPQPPRNVWDSLRDSLNFNVTFDKFVDADNHLTVRHSPWSVLSQ